jgi:hypothetical protein
MSLIHNHGPRSWWVTNSTLRSFLLSKFFGLSLEDVARWTLELKADPDATCLSTHCPVATVYWQSSRGIISLSVSFLAKSSKTSQTSFTFVQILLLTYDKRVVVTCFAVRWQRLTNMQGINISYAANTICPTSNLNYWRYATEFGWRGRGKLIITRYG